MTMLVLTAHDLEEEKSLRELRVWHWKQAQRSADSVRRLNSELQGESYVPQRALLKRHMAGYNEQFIQHMKFVQTLNNFFPEADTAEKDAMK